MDSNPATTIGAPAIGNMPLGAPLKQHADTLDPRWTAWIIFYAVSLVMVLLAVYGAGYSTSLLLGWAGGIIVAAILTAISR